MRARGLIASFAVVALSMALGCTADERTSPESPRPVPGISEEATSPSEAQTSSASANASLEQVSIRLERVVSGLEDPTFATHAGDGSGRIFVLEQTGRIRVVRDGQLAARAFLAISRKISSGGERGLLGLAFSPDYEDSGDFYVNYTNRQGDTVVERYSAQNPASDSPRVRAAGVVFTADQPYANHNGGCIVFAPDGTLWVGMGDGGSAGDPGNRAQDKSEVLGKILSLDVAGAKGKPKPKMIHYGLRNPWRFTFDTPKKELWIGDVGQSSWEEINVVGAAKRGLNFGWNRWEGNHAYPPGARRSRKGFTFPAIEYDSRKGQSVTGGYVYRGSDYPQLAGVYFYGDFVSGWIAGAMRDGSGKMRSKDLLRDSGIMPSSFGVDESGELYVCDYNGALLRIVAK